MLKQILQDMYIEPELLAELNEHQKQILFFKIREEQVRRWKERESQEQSPARPPSKKESRGIRWLPGSDGDVWVWVMGEAAGDRPFENIMNELMEKRARRQAHEDAQEISRVQQEEMEKRFRDTLAKQKACLLAGKWRSEVVNKEMKKQAGEEKQVLAAQGNCEEDEQKEHKDDTCTETDKQEDRQHETEDNEWQEQLRRSKAADEAMKSKALRAREECKRHSLRALETSLIALRFHKSFMNGDSQSRRRSTALDHNVTDSSSVCPRPDRPTTRESIIHWFRAEQQPKRAGYERHSNSLAPWFHGIISRQEAESLLAEQPEGSFLLRVSECIWGFTLSYRTADAFKHFLVDASADYYSFIGLDQIQHATLADLVSFHREEVITTSGRELLRHACPPRNTSTHYGGLFE